MLDDLAVTTPKPRERDLSLDAEQTPGTDSGDESLLSQPLQVGPVTYRNRVLLAPMSGVSDVPYRRAAWRGGAGMVISEMVASEALVTGQAEMQLKAESAGLPLHVVQLAGREARWMDHAARLAEANGADVIDINMGCPARRVTGGYSGSALMQNPDHALSLVEAVVQAVKVPVTLKMRLGWDHASINAPDIARRAEQAGVQLVTVHGRTRCQFYKGRADWKAVRAVRQATRLPLLVNGDISSRAEAVAALAQSGADGLMIGRAAYGQPDLPGRIAGSHGDGKQYDMVAHYADMIGFYGAGTGVRCARKHIGWWMDLNCPDLAGKRRREILTARDPQQVITALEALSAMTKQGQGNARRAA